MPAQKTISSKKKTAAPDKKREIMKLLRTSQLWTGVATMIVIAIVFVRILASRYDTGAVLTTSNNKRLKKTPPYVKTLADTSGFIIGSPIAPTATPTPTPAQSTNSSATSNSSPSISSPSSNPDPTRPSQPSSSHEDQQPSIVGVPTPLVVLPEVDKKPQDDSNSPLQEAPKEKKDHDFSGQDTHEDHIHLAEN